MTSDEAKADMMTKLGRLSACIIVLAGLAVSACQSDNAVTGSTFPSDYRARHPIALTYAPATLDLFTGRNVSGLDLRQSRDVQDFVLDYRRKGRGPMTMLVPSGVGDRGYPIGAGAVKARLAAAGVGSRDLHVDTYQVSDSSIAAPIRLSFTKIQAKVASECGTWPSDIGGLQVNFQNWQNKPWYNMGCAYQTQFAVQVANPIDLVRPQSETRADTEKRMHAFEQLRKGRDPSTNWNGGEATINGGS